MTLRSREVWGEFGAKSLKVYITCKANKLCKRVEIWDIKESKIQKNYERQKQRSKLNEYWFIEKAETHEAKIDFLWIYIFEDYLRNIPSPIY